MGGGMGSGSEIKGHKGGHVKANSAAVEDQR